MQPLISVIIPVYNVEKYLAQCLDSVLGQTYQNLEIICVNDGSTDKSLDILREYERKESRIHVIAKKNEGVSIARNTGLDAATGEYVHFLDSDDWINSNLYEEALVCFAPDIDVVWFEHIQHLEDGSRQMFPLPLQGAHVVGDSLLLSSEFTPHGTKSLRCRVYANIISAFQSILSMKIWLFTGACSQLPSIKYFSSTRHCTITE